MVEANGILERIGVRDLSDLMRWSVNGMTGRAATLTLSVRPHIPRRDEDKNRLYEGDVFTLVLLSTDPADSFFTTFNVYPDGRVSLLQESRHLAIEQEIPPLAEQDQEGGIFDAHLAEAGVPAEDVFVVVSTTHPLDTSRFSILQPEGGPVTGEHSYKLHEFMTWLDQQRRILREIALLHVRTEPRASKSPSTLGHSWRENCIASRQVSEPMCARWPRWH